MVNGEEELKWKLTMLEVYPIQEISAIGKISSKVAAY